MLRGLTGITLGQCQLEDTALRASSFGRAHRDPSVRLLDVSTIHRLLARFQHHILHVVHLSYLNEMQQCICMNAKFRVAQQYRCYYCSFTIKLQSNKQQTIISHGQSFIEQLTNNSNYPRHHDQQHKRTILTSPSKLKWFPITSKSWFINKSTTQHTYSSKFKKKLNQTKGKQNQLSCKIQPKTYSQLSRTIHVIRQLLEQD